MSQNTEIAEEIEKGNVSPTNSPMQSIFGGIMENVPNVSEHVVERGVDGITNKPEAGQETSKQVGGVVDKHGNPFDPAIHQTNEDGTPKLNNNGTCRMKPGRHPANKRGNGGDTSTRAVESQLGDLGGHDEPETGHQGPPEIDPDCKMLAGVCAHSMGVVRQTISDLQTKPEEHAYLENCFYEWAQAKNFSTGPDAALALGIGFFMLPALKEQKTQNIFGRAWTKFSSLFKRKKIDPYSEKEKAKKEKEKNGGK